MDYIAPETDPWGIVVSIFIIVLGLAVLATGAFFGRSGYLSGGIGLGTLGVVLALIGSLLFPNADTTVLAVGGQRSAVASAIEARYGLSLDSTEILKLDYPTRRPESNFEEYGTIEALVPDGDDYKRIKTTLIWDHGEIKLVGTENSSEFKELETK